MPYVDVLKVPHFYTLTPASSTCSAPTLVFVHGWLLSHAYWAPVIECLNSDFQCLSYDLRGFGTSNRHLAARSPGPQTRSTGTSVYSLSAYAEDLGLLLQTLKVGPVWLVGHSLVGSIALWAAHYFPDQVQGVVCVNAGGGVYLPDEFARFRRAGQQILRWRPSWLRSVPFIECAFAQIMVSRPLALQWGEQRVTDLLVADRDAALGVLLESTTEAEVHRLPQVVASLRQPVHFVAGAEDTVMAEKYVRHLASFHSSFQKTTGNVTVLPDCGHLAMLEQPQALAQTLQTLVSSPLAQPPGARPTPVVG